MTPDSPPPPATHDRSTEWLMRIARYALKNVLYHAVYPSKVVSQADDGTLELQPDSKLVGGIKKVPIRLGVPGIKVKVKPGARCSLGFENGDPRLPYAGFWEPDQLSEVSVVAATKVSFDAAEVDLVPGGQPNARQGDVCASGGQGMTPIPVSVSFAPIPVVLTLDAPFPMTPPYITSAVLTPSPASGNMTLLAPLYGLIVSGQTTVKS